MNINPLEILLDNRNYRILPYLRTDITNQQLIRNCLAEHARDFKMQDIIDSILSKEWMPLGARPVVIPHEGVYIVVEGNRRICACQMILDQDIRHSGIRFPQPISQEVLRSIQNIEVDVAPNREILMPFLSERHIKSPVKWSTQSKQLACLDYYAAGYSIDQICADLNLGSGQVTNILRGYYLVEYVKGLEDWNIDEHNILLAGPLKVDRLLRLFGTSGASEDFGLSYGDDFTPTSNKHNTEILNRALGILARKAFIENTINTRTTWSDIKKRPDCEEIRQILNITTPPVDPDITIEEDDEEPTPPIITEELGPSLPEEVTSVPRPPQLPVFFQALHCNLNVNEHAYSGLIALAREIKLISNRGFHGINTYTVAGALLLRSLLEQSLKLYLKTQKEQPIKTNTYWDQLTRGRDSSFDPPLRDIITFIERKINSGVLVFSDNNESFRNALGEHTLHKAILDQLTHRTDVFLISRDGLETMARQGMLSLINIIMEALPENFE